MDREKERSGPAGPVRKRRERRGQRALDDLAAGSCGRSSRSALGFVFLMLQRSQLIEVNKKKVFNCSYDKRRIRNLNHSVYQEGILVPIVSLSG